MHFLKYSKAMLAIHGGGFHSKVEGSISSGNSIPSVLIQVVIFNHWPFHNQSLGCKALRLLHEVQFLIQSSNTREHSRADSFKGIKLSMLTPVSTPSDKLPLDRPSVP